VFFVQNRFCPETIADARLRTALCATSAFTNTARVGTGDLLCGALWGGDRLVRDTLILALEAGASLSDPAAPPSRCPSRSRDEFSPTALAALDATERFYAGAPTRARAAALDLLLFHACAQPEGEIEKALRGLNCERAALLFQTRVQQAIGGDEFRLSPEIAPSVDLSHRLRTQEMAEGYPFDGEPSYQPLFEAMTRVLHRRQTRHVLLVGERGVGKTTIVAELARRSAMGKSTFLADRRFVTVRAKSHWLA
jgi:hypothetical protein